MAVIFAHFQSSGNSPVLIEVSKIMAKGVHSDMLTSFSTPGCIPSGSGDFEINTVCQIQDKNENLTYLKTIIRLSPLTQIRKKPTY
jgi:hypothetical protein